MPLNFVRWGESKLLLKLIKGRLDCTRVANSQCSKNGVWAVFYFNFGIVDGEKHLTIPLFVVSSDLA